LKRGGRFPAVLHGSGPSGRHDELRKKTTKRESKANNLDTVPKLSLLSSITYIFCEENKKRNKEYEIRHFLSLFERKTTNFSTKTAFSDAFCHAVSVLRRENPGRSLP
jgi:hypothetical protein